MTLKTITSKLFSAIRQLRAQFIELILIFYCKTQSLIRMSRQTPALKPSGEAKIDIKLQNQTNDPKKDLRNNSTGQHSMLLISIFILLNVYKPLALQLLGAISISGLDTSLSKYILYSLLFFFTLISMIIIPLFFRKIKREANVWTAVVFCEALKENKRSSLVGVLYSITLVAINIAEWISCDSTGYNEFLERNCKRFATTSGFASSLLVSLIGLLQYITYKGSYRITLPLSDALMTKMRLPKIKGIPAFWMDTGYILNSLRTISLICSGNKYKSREQLRSAYPELAWRLVEDFTFEDLKVIKGYFVDNNESIVSLKREAEIKKFLEIKFEEEPKSEESKITYKQGFKLAAEVFKAYVIREPDLLDFCIPKKDSIFRPNMKTFVQNILQSFDRLIIDLQISLQEGIKFKDTYKQKIESIKKDNYVSYIEAYDMIGQVLRNKELKLPELFEFVVDSHYLEFKMDKKKFINLAWQLIEKGCKKLALGDIVR